MQCHNTSEGLLLTAVRIHCDETKQMFNGDRNPEHKKSSNRTTMSPTTNIDSQLRTIWNKLKKDPSFSLAIKKGSKVINDNWVNNHA